MIDKSIKMMLYERREGGKDHSLTYISWIFRWFLSVYLQPSLLSSYIRSSLVATELD